MTGRQRAAGPDEAPAVLSQAEAPAGERQPVAVENGSSKPCSPSCSLSVCHDSCNFNI